MSRWVIYASPDQDNVADWKRFEQMLIVQGLKVYCTPKMTEKSKKAFVVVDDPRGILEERFKGPARADMLSRRVRALISNWREAHDRG